MATCLKRRGEREGEREGKESKEKVYKLSINLFCFAGFQFVKAKVENNMENVFQHQ